MKIDLRIMQINGRRDTDIWSSLMQIDLTTV